MASKLQLSLVSNGAVEEGWRVGGGGAEVFDELEVGWWGGVGEDGRCGAAPLALPGGPDRTALLAAPIAASVTQ
jgi:hypothetical protein